MGIGSAFAAGYGSGAKSVDQRSYMPIINALGRKIGNNRGGGAVRSVGSGRPTMDTNRRERRLQEREDEANQEEQWRYEEESRRKDIQAAEQSEIRQSEEGRRQETADINAETARQTQQTAELNFTKAKSKDERKEAFQMIKQGLMMKNPQMLKTGFSALSPDAEDEIMEAEPLGDGVRSFQGRPGEKQIPRFIFDPDSDAVGVIFPGSNKPTAFRDTEQAFKHVVGPMNPDHEMSKDQINNKKATQEAAFKNKKLTAETHESAHQAAMQHFYRDGEFQQALYSKDEYDKYYKEYIENAGGGPPKITNASFGGGSEGADELPENHYMGDSPPSGFPDAKRGKDGGWYTPKGDGWSAITDHREKGKKKPKPKPKPKKKPKKKPAIKHRATAGVARPAGAEQATPAGREIMKQMDDKPKVIRNKMPDRPGQKQVPYKGKAKPAHQPDAQYDEKKGEWTYFDEESGEWKTVMESDNFKGGV
jgi:hypothetical protein